eukprot:722488-Prorocentrum_minimum.AAC.6
MCRRCAISPPRGGVAGPTAERRRPSWPRWPHWPPPPPSGARTRAPASPPRPPPRPPPRAATRAAPAACGDAQHAHNKRTQQGFRFNLGPRADLNIVRS